MPRLDVTILKNADGSMQKSAIGAPVLDPATWPNTGIGRLNPDGSRGTCSACHSRHNFSKAMARQPEVCGKCHLGPDHPQAEIYEESKHGIAYRTRKDEMNLKSDTWVVGVDYTAAPTCSTCHMSATKTQGQTHDVGARISWTLRPVISKKLENWEKKRASMKDVCSACHGGAFVDSEVPLTGEGGRTRRREGTRRDQGRRGGPAPRVAEGPLAGGPQKDRRVLQAEIRELIGAAPTVRAWRRPVSERTSSKSVRIIELRI